MLPAASRLRARSDFTEVVRCGRRAGRPLLTVHQLSPIDSSPEAPVRAGLIVSKAVGGSVARTRVSRRLRHLLRERLIPLRPGTRLVVRAAPAAAGGSSAQLGADLDAALSRLARRERPTQPSESSPSPTRPAGPALPRVEL